MRKLAIGAIKFYRFALSPLLGKNCRFYPTCSCYAEEALDRYGFFKGGYLTMLRLVKCHPFHPGGYDPVGGQDDTGVNTTCNNNHTEL
ncbi:MAG: membrane protein insertion efficiency factor YidD [Porticoccaceae bacterium]|nr:membrane protein insertion efficiency factor YidD [Porticoccaceae bacterium]